MNLALIETIYSTGLGLFLAIGWPVYLLRTIRQYHRVKNRSDEDMGLLWLSTVTELRIIGLIVFPLGACMGWNHLWLVFIKKERSL